MGTFLIDEFYGFGRAVGTFLIDDGLQLLLWSAATCTDVKGALLVFSKCKIQGDKLQPQGFALKRFNVIDMKNPRSHNDTQEISTLLFGLRKGHF